MPVLIYFVQVRLLLPHHCEKDMVSVQIGIENMPSLVAVVLRLVVVVTVAVVVVAVAAAAAAVDHRLD